MGKYEPLARYLKSRSDDSWNATFSDIEARLGFRLPASAHQHRAWWANQKDGNHSQTAGWQDAGWETEAVDLKRGLVTFARRLPRSGSATSSSLKPDPDLWNRAREVTGIEDRDTLIEAGLLALIQREAARYLAALGGTMPDAEAPPRRRFE